MPIRSYQRSFIYPFISATLFFLVLFAGKAETQSLVWWTAHALVKVRPRDALPSNKSQTVGLFAGRNEFEPFQIVLRAENQKVQNVDVQASDLAGPSGASIASDNITIYLERYLNLKTASSVEGDADEWPDPLIPKADRYAGEKRNAFPFSLTAGRNQPLWIEVFVPPSAPPGTYSGQVKITAEGLPDISVPIKLLVWNFILPSTSTLKTSFGFNGVGALKQHRGDYTNDGDLAAITFLYAKAALWHRISTHGGTMAPPPLSGNGQIDWSRYDREMGPFLDGTVFSKGQPLSGARATSVDLRTIGSADTPEKKVLYWKQWVKHFEDKGWMDRLFYYVRDEPTPKNYSQILELGALAHSVDPRIRNLVTTSFAPSLEKVIDIWTPLINCMELKPGFPDFCEHTVPREAYNTEIQKGKSLWWYQSCASHGCNGGGGDYFRGWPSYMIDVPSVANRIFPWLSWKYRIEGELYFNMDEGFSKAADPWTTLYLFGGNGDGTLFYPGQPAQIGGKTDIPIESIRMKLIREGLEDYEYMALLSKAGRGDCADETVSRIVEKTYHWEQDAEKLYAARRELGEKLTAQFNQGNLGGSVARERIGGDKVLPTSRSCPSSD